MSARALWLLDQAAMCRGNAARVDLLPEVRAAWLQDAEVVQRAAERLLVEDALSARCAHLSLAPLGSDLRELA